MDGFKVFEEEADIPDITVLECLMSLPEMVMYGLAINVGDHDRSKKVCIFSVGHSSIAGDVIAAYADYFSDIPVINMADGIIPGWLDNETDVIIVSYTGNSVLINDMYESLKGKIHSMVCVTSGGRLLNKCQVDGNRTIVMPNGLTSRTAIGIEIGVLASIVQKMGVRDICNNLNDICPVIANYRDSLYDNDAVKEIIEKLKGNAVAFYGLPDLRASYRRWKMSYNADSGLLAFCGELPEFNHNEIVGWGNHNQDEENLKIVFLRSRSKNEVFTMITDKTLEVMEEYQRNVIDIEVLGDGPIERNLRSILLGDYVSWMIGNNGRGLRDGRSYSNE